MVSNGSVAISADFMAVIGSCEKLCLELVKAMIRACEKCLLRTKKHRQRSPRLPATPTGCIGSTRHGPIARL